MATLVCSGNETVCDLSNEPESANFLLYSNGERILLVVIIPIILVIGVTANFAFIFTVCRLRHMRTITNYYLFNLALSDLCFLCCATWDKLGLYLASPVFDDQMGLGPWGCCLLYYTTNICYFASLFLVTTVTVEKYYAVCKPVRHRIISGEERTRKTLLTVWAVALVFAAILIPSHAIWSFYNMIWPNKEEFENFPSQVGKCEPVSYLAYFVSDGIKTIPFFAVMCINVYMYVRIVKTLSMRIHAHPGLIAANERLHNIINARSQRTRNQVARMLVINGVIFFCLMSPFQMFSLYEMIAGLATDNLSRDPYTTRRLLWSFRVLSYINTTINPFVYTMSNKRYRRAFCLAIPCLKRTCLRHRPPVPLNAPAAAVCVLPTNFDEARLNKQKNTPPRNSHADSNCWPSTSSTPQTISLCPTEK